MKVSVLFSHKELLRTPDKDRFCPYILIRGISETDMINIKNRLHSSGLLFDDGHPFRGADFNLKNIVRYPTKENLWKMKFLTSEAEIIEVLNLIEGSPKKVYDFYVTSRISDGALPVDCSYNSISIEDPSFINLIL